MQFTAYSSHQQTTFRQPQNEQSNVIEGEFEEKPKKD